jgi:hypothetical protein
MTFVGVVGIVLGIFALSGALIEQTRFRIGVFFTAYILHLSTTLFYFWLVQNSVADSALYYYDFLNYYQEGFGLNTQFIIYIVQTSKLLVGGTYLDYFLIFQAIGFFGIAILMRIIEEIYRDLGIEPSWLIYALLFMPSLHYWSSALGKDSLFLFAIALSIWASMSIRTRLTGMLIAITILILIRPHIAMVSLAALALTVLRDRQTSVAVRAIFFAASTLGVIYAISIVRTTFNFDITDPNALSDVLSGTGRDALAQSEDAGRTAVNAAYPIRVLSLMFRPFFYDSGGGLGLIVSFENLLFLFMVGALIYHGRTVLRLMKVVPYMKFALLSSVGILLMLSIGYYNVGLGIRQKATMILPGFFVAFVTLRAVLQARFEKQSLEAPQAVWPSKVGAIPTLPGR